MTTQTTPSTLPLPVPEPGPGLAGLEPEYAQIVAALTSRFPGESPDQLVNRARRVEVLCNDLQAQLDDWHREQATSR